MALSLLSAELGMQTEEQQHSQLVGDCLLALINSIMELKDIPPVPVKGRRLQEGLLQVCMGSASCNLHVQAAAPQVEYRW